VVIDVDDGARLEPLNTSAPTVPSETCVRECCEQASAIRAGQAEACSPCGSQPTLLVRAREHEFLPLAAACRRHAGDHAGRALQALMFDPRRRAASGDVGSVETLGDDTFEPVLGDDADERNAVGECAWCAPCGRLEPKLIEELPPAPIRQCPDCEAVEMQDVENHETSERDRTVSLLADETKAQPLEIGLAVAVKTDNFAVEDHASVGAESRGDVLELWELCCPVATRPRPQADCPVLHV
jgi:hypothetical protein